MRRRASDDTRHVVTDLTTSESRTPAYICGKYWTIKQADRNYGAAA